MDLGGALCGFCCLDFDLVTLEEVIWLISKIWMWCSGYGIFEIATSLRKY